MILQLTSSNYTEFTIMTPKVHNYHFAPRGNMLSLISKNYYDAIFTWISWICNLTNIYTWNNNILPNTIKLWKLVTGATDLETRMWKYHGKACDGEYAMELLHASTEGQKVNDSWKTHGQVITIEKASRPRLITTNIDCLAWFKQRT